MNRVLEGGSFPRGLKDSYWKSINQCPCSADIELTLDDDYRMGQASKSHLTGLPLSPPTHIQRHANSTSLELSPINVFKEGVNSEPITSPISKPQALLRVLLQQCLTEVLAGLAELVSVLDRLREDPLLELLVLHLHGGTHIMLNPCQAHQHRQSWPLRLQETSQPLLVSGQG